MKSEEICFMPLGGGQRVGASCYYLKLGSQNIILDAGIGFNKGVIFEPDFMPLLTSPFMFSLNQINQIFISHAHLDHTGCLLNLMRDAQHACVYMTEPSKLFTEHQLYDKKFSDNNENNENQRLAAQYLLNNIITVNYMQSINFNEYSAEFFQAGHIPGAMMTLFNYKGKKILYTGDYSLRPTALTNGCIIPDDLEVDILIMCAVHAKHPDYKRHSDFIYKNIGSIFLEAKRGKTVVCHINQLSKGVEFLKILNSMNTHNVKIFIDEDTFGTVRIMEKLFEPVLTVNNYPVSEFYSYGKGIVITSSGTKILTGNKIDVTVDFSLHEDFDDMKNFIRRLNPKQAVIVHCAPSRSYYEYTIEQEIMRDYSCRTQFIFAEEQQLYIL